MNSYPEFLYEFPEFIYEFPMNSLKANMKSLNSYMNFLNSYMNWNHELTYEFMKKTYDFSGTKMGLRMNSYTWIEIEFINKFMFTCLNSYMNSYIKQIWWITRIHIRISVSTQNVNAYMNLFTNIHNMAIRVLRRSLAGCSRSEQWRRLRLWRRGCGESLSQWWQAASAAVSEWGSSELHGLRKWLGPRRVTAGRREYFGTKSLQSSRASY